MTSKNTNVSGQGLPLQELLAAYHSGRGIAIAGGGNRKRLFRPAATPTARAVSRRLSGEIPCGRRLPASEMGTGAWDSARAGESERSRGRRNFLTAVGRHSPFNDFGKNSFCISSGWDSTCIENEQVSPVAALDVTAVFRCIRTIHRQIHCR